ncbi:serine/threonine-protein kinase [Nocardiopsis composta]|uniref:non-specific serine/threonine protein kinase n=1 Tax=Nocardiopsis composta TaxID=157465 RepID=A0A7W8QQB8_9ACTN|nr:serine/threonine-protein kinase [Nocardiopsis composta]MBB5433656.1 serine/threonine-protein kinase [Nocardiopsis composta]
MTDNDSGAAEERSGPAGDLLSGRYQLDEQIGSGGMGTVWRATDTILNRPVAVKLLHPAQMAEPTARERFRTEARITAGLSHPGIAQVYDYGEQGDRAFLVMELVLGETLSSILKRNDGLEPGATLDILAQSAAALASAHGRGVVHRDIKPGNLMVTDDGTVKLTDFGIARGEHSVTLTQTGMVMGTAQYISPEQASGRPATYASDIYALGVVAYECLAGQPPFTADSPIALALAHTREPPPPLPDSLPPQLIELVETMLAKAPDDRPESAGEVARVAQLLRSAANEDLGATTAMDLTDPTRTVLAGGGPITAAQRKGTAAVREQDGAPAARRGGRPNLPVVLAAVVAAIAVVVGVAWAGSYFNGNGQDGQPVGDRENASPSSSPSATPSVDETPDEGVVDEGTGDGGYIPETGGDPLPPTDGQPTAPDTPVEPDPGQSTDPGGDPGTEEPPPPDDTGDPGNGGGGTEPGEGDDPGDDDGA